MQVSIETTDVLLRNITLMILSILLIGICLKKLHQPYYNTTTNSDHWVNLIK